MKIIIAIKMEAKKIFAVLINHCVIAIFFAFTFLTCTNETNNPVVPALDNTKLYSELENFTDSLINKLNIPGVVLGVWAPDKNINWFKAKGLAEIPAKQQMKTSNLFRIGSITKTFVTTAILQLVDEGKLSLDDTLSKFFPDFPNSDKIKIRRLCDMTSGIFDYTEDESFIDSILNRSLTEKIHPLDLINLVKDKPLYYIPGYGWHFSNTNTILLGLIIEKITGHKVEYEISQRFLVPLKLNNTFFPTDKYMPGEFAHGYSSHYGAFNEDVSEKYDPSWIWASGAMISNAQDLRTWIEVLAKGTLISEKLQKERLKYWYIENTDYAYGLGIHQFISFLGHEGMNMPGYVTMAFYSPQKNTTIILLYNTDAFEYPEALYQELIVKVHPDIFDLFFK